jgi:sugar phosphate isomerase/epimerase
MKIGFTTLALFEKSFDEQLDIAIADGFNIVEILCEGPNLPRFALKDLEKFNTTHSYDLELTIHSPTIDLNPASLNIGVREETLKQLEETTDFASAVDATAVTTHPGQVLKPVDWVISASRNYALDVLSKWADYTADVGIVPSIENMPNKRIYFCKDVEEHQLFVESCGSFATVDIGHANTTNTLNEFLAVNYKVAYHHVSDNDGKHDQHLRLGEGTIKVNLLKEIKRAIIEVNNYQDVIRSKKLLTYM